jgi:hypothetical protein
VVGVVKGGGYALVLAEIAVEDSVRLDQLVSSCQGR